MAEWSNELALEFIQLYEKYPVLWNPKHSGHKNRNCLNDAWLSISRELSVEMSIPALKKKKESLMSAYRAVRKKVTDSETTGSGSKDIYNPSWFAYDAIDRFIRVTGNKKTSLASEDDVVENATENEFLTQNEEEEDEREREGQLDSNLDINKNSVEEKIVKKKRKNNQIEAQVTKHLKQAGNALETLVNKTSMQQTQFPQDGAALYGQLLADKLRKLSARSSLIVQNKIDNLVFEAQMKECDSSEIQSPDTPGSTMPPYPSPTIYITSGPSSQTSPTRSQTQETPTRSPIVEYYYTTTDGLNDEDFPQSNE